VSRTIQPHLKVFPEGGTPSDLNQNIRKHIRTGLAGGREGIGRGQRVTVKAEEIVRFPRLIKGQDFWGIGLTQKKTALCA